MQAVILAGGRGSRLATALGCDIPKPMASILGTPLLERTVNMLSNQGYREILMLVHHRADVVINHFGTGIDFGVNIDYITERVPRGTGGALLDALQMLEDEFLLLYGDTMVDIELCRIREFHSCRNSDVTLYVHPNDHPLDSDLVELDANGRVTALHPYPHPKDTEYHNLVNAALYVVKKSSLSLLEWPSGAFDIAKYAIPAWIEANVRMYGFRGDGYIKDMGTPERLGKVEQDLKVGIVARKSGRNPRPAVLLDRDGTINVLKGHLARPEDLELYPCVGSAIRSLNTAGVLAIIITNQPVIARGEASFEQVDAIHRRLENLLAAEGAFLDGILYCPHHPEGGFEGELAELKVCCGCRKPAPGLIEEVCRIYHIDLSRTWFIGDSTADFECARRIGVKSIGVETGEAGRDGKYNAIPTASAKNVAMGIDLVLRHEGLCH